MTAGVIDLDVAPPAGPAAPRRGPPAARAALLAGLAALLLALLGAAQPPPAGPRPVLRVTDRATVFALGPGALWTASPAGEGRDASTVRAWDLATGAARWSVALRQYTQNLTYDAAAGVVMAGSGNDPRVTFLDAATGAVLWATTSPSSTVHTLTAGAVLLGDGTGPGRTRLTVLAARTGAVIWRRDVAAEAYLWWDGRRIVAVGTDGRVAVLGFADGAPRAAGDLGVRLTPGYDPSLQADFVGVGAVGDRLYVSDREGAAATLTAYALEPFARLWRTAGVPVGHPSDCGPVVCVGDTRTVAAVDRADGRVRWSDTRWGYAGRGAGGRLLAYGRQPGDPRAVLLDPATGAVRVRLGNVTAVGPLLLRTDGAAPGRIWVQRAGAAGARPLGAVDTGADPFGCAARDDLLACPTAAGPTTVWRLPPG